MLLGRFPQYTRCAFTPPTFVRHVCHVQNGCAYASRPIIAQFEDPLKWETARKDGAVPIQLTTPLPVFAPRERVCPIAAGHEHEHEHDRRVDAKIPCVYGYPPAVFAVSTPAPLTSTRAPYVSPHSHRPAMSLQTDTRPSRPPVRTHDMVYRRPGMRISPFRIQMPIILGTDTSSILQLLHLPSHHG